MFLGLSLTPDSPDRSLLTLVIEFPLTPNPSSFPHVSTICPRRGVERRVRVLQTSSHTTSNPQKNYTLEAHFSLCDKGYGGPTSPVMLRDLFEERMPQSLPR